MFMPWITIPIEDVRIQLPANPYDKEVRIMFRDVGAVEKTAEQLEKLKELLATKK